MAASVEKSLLFVVGNAILDVVLNIIPKFGVLFVDGIGFASDVAHRPNDHRDILQSKSTAIKATLYYRLQPSIE